MYRRRLREGRRHHHRVFIAHDRVRFAFAGLVHAVLETSRALAGLVAVAFAVTVTIAASAAAAATTAAAFAGLAIAVASHRSFARFAFFAGIFLGRTGVMILVRDVVLGGGLVRERGRRALSSFTTLAAFAAPAAAAATTATPAARLAFALLAGGVAAWFVVARIMSLPSFFLPEVAVGTILLSLALTVGIGLAGTWRVLGHKAAPGLRTL